MHLTLRSIALVPLAGILLTGCHVNEHKDGDKDNVDISTPFGGMHVKTNGNSADTSAIGLTVYPGAIPASHDDGNDTNNANVDMSFGAFHLGVRAASFQTPDRPDKVLAFYRKDLGRFGDVIECQHDKAVGSPTHTTLGLSCDSKGHNHTITSSSDGIHINDSASSDNIELRAGSEQHQHIVGIDPKNGGTRIGLVALDLPSHLSVHDDKDSE
jgi:hypothetical protein